MTDPAELRQCLETLEAIASDRRLLAELETHERNRLLMAAGQVSRPDRPEQKALAKTLRKRRRKASREADERQLDASGIRRLRAQPVFVTPPPELLAPVLPGVAARELSGERICYVCKEPYRQLHAFYDQLCPACGDFNYAKRGQTADLSGRHALVTGARVKIGYQAAILLLRSGAEVTVTTRFPRDAARRYAREPDHGAWAHRLRIHGVDLRHTPSVEALAAHLAANAPRLDFIIHNACQTVRRPSGFYAHLMHGERAPFSSLPEPEQRLLAAAEALLAEDPRLLASRSAATGLTGEQLRQGQAVAGGAAELSQVPLLSEDLRRGEQLFPAGQLDADEQQVDLREVNSWRLTLDQVPTVELLEVQLVNQIAPFVLNGRLRSLMRHTPGREKHIVNVSAMEGQFYRRFKTDKHPHTNMAKAALNMMTRTSAPDYLSDGIHMNSVDTGWVTDEDPALIAERKRSEQGFHPPLDIVDGAARIVDPILHGINSGKHQWGLFLKDYQPVPW